MQKNWKYAHRSGTLVYKSFCNGFTAFSGTLVGAGSYEGTANRNAFVYHSFTEDQKNLRADFVKSFLSVLAEDEESNNKDQLSLNLTGIVDNGGAALEND